MCTCVPHSLYNFKYFELLVIIMPPNFRPQDFIRPEHFGNPFRFGTELAYTLIVVILFFLVYRKTKEMYDLSKYEGIKYFRNSFLFFAIAYLSRLAFHFLQMSTIALDLEISRRVIFPFSMLLAGYFSTIAIFYLSYSTVWKKISHKFFIITANIFALIVSTMAWFSRSPEIVSLFQLILLAVTLFIVAKEHKNKNNKTKKSNALVLYVLISLFWFMNFFSLGRGWFISFEGKTIFQLLSLVVFVFLYNKVNKWIK